LWVLALCAFASLVQGEVTIEVDDDAGVGLEENLRARLRLAVESCESPPWRVRRLFRAADKDLLPALRAFGFYRPVIAKELHTEGECWHATFRVEPGGRVTVRERTVTVRGDMRDDEGFAALFAGLPLVAGAPLHHGQYEEIKTRLLDFATERGYFDSELTRKELRVYPDESQADILIEAQSGPRYRFGELRLSEHRLDDGFLRRLTGVREGEPYAARSLIETSRQLTNSGYFRRVEVRALREHRKDGKVPVQIVLEPAARHAWRTGVGFATDTGPRASLRYENRLLNRRGHRFESELRLSPVESGLTADYLVPGKDPLRETYSIGVGLLREDTDTSTSDSIGVIGRQTIKSDPWIQTRFLELLHESSDIGDEEVESTLLMPGLDLTRVQVDDILRARRGHRVNLEIRGAYEGLVSDATFLQLRANAKLIHRFGDSGRIVARADAGTTVGDGASDLPASIRFFAGGDNSVRGYEYQSLGPKDDNGDVAGGRHLLTASIGYEHPVFGEDWWLAAFADAGNAFERGDLDLRAGYGVGVRWYSPVGRLQVDLAFPDDTDEDDWRLHIRLGADL
jgi:translocation and assembly module TamA